MPVMSHPRKLIATACCTRANPPDWVGDVDRLPLHSLGSTSTTPYTAGGMPPSLRSQDKLPDEFESLLQRLQEARTHQEWATTLRATVQAIRAQRASVDSFLHQLWETVHENEIFGSRPNDTDGLPVPDHCFPRSPSPAMSTAMQNWGSNCFEVLWRRGAYIPQQWSQNFGQHMVYLAKHFRLEVFSQAAIEVLRKKRPTGKKTAIHVTGSRLLQTADLQDIRLQLQPNKVKRAGTTSTSEYTAKRTGSELDNTAVVASLLVRKKTRTLQDTPEQARAAQHADSGLHEAPTPSRSTTRESSYIYPASPSSSQAAVHDPLADERFAEPQLTYESDITDADALPRSVQGRKSRASEPNSSPQTQPLDRIRLSSDPNAPHLDQRSDIRESDAYLLSASELTDDNWVSHLTVFTVLQRVMTQRTSRLYDIGSLSCLSSLDDWSPTMPTSFDDRFLLIPFNLPLTVGLKPESGEDRMRHWVLIEIDNQQRRYRVFDPQIEITQSRKSEVMSIIRNMTSGLDAAENAESRPWTDATPSSGIPQQDSPGSCGVYTMYFTLCLAARANIKDIGSLVLRSFFKALVATDATGCTPLILISPAVLPAEDNQADSHIDIAALVRSCSDLQVLSSEHLPTISSLMDQTFENLTTDKTELMASIQVATTRLAMLREYQSSLETLRADSFLQHHTDRALTAQQLLTRKVISQTRLLERRLLQAEVSTASVQKAQSILSTWQATSAQKLQEQKRQYQLAAERFNRTYTKELEDIKARQKLLELRKHAAEEASLRFQTLF
ncbi:uncharacterized protein M421DRAFT_426508 [Didymella exigua CBS 183.55]|uniref:Ubiquitin-like protease family profile domain-containing protein n=1 Tax=Didymella exigua CBS 183.55 TaxID=1150837 RepID=A0A6A5R726_9PLEO|nr:uncharacterized protein M421DRAFT_426508 [Didymella exigua CBS 183.55]KAF1922774.1 hypothetical protein M421DRAFT_426508 [Didymella exigua CBS 183.55]